MSTAVLERGGDELPSATALFQDITPASAPPVSVEGIGYDLETALRPDPDPPHAHLAARLHAT